MVWVPTRRGYVRGFDERLTNSTTHTLLRGEWFLVSMLLVLWKCPRVPHPQGSACGTIEQLRLKRTLAQNFRGASFSGAPPPFARRMARR
jgi:hypothetical protein